MKKKFVVNSKVSSKELGDASAWLIGTSDMLRDAGEKDVKLKTCYCCAKEGTVVCEFDAPSKESLIAALEKIELPVESVMETEKIEVKKK